MQYYIWRDDITGHLLLEALRAAADRVGDFVIEPQLRPAEVRQGEGRLVEVRLAEVAPAFVHSLVRIAGEVLNVATGVDVDVEPERAAAAEQSGAVDQRVDASEARDRCRDHVVHLLRTGDVGAHEQRFAARLQEAFAALRLGDEPDVRVFNQADLMESANQQSGFLTMLLAGIALQFAPVAGTGGTLGYA